MPRKRGYRHTIKSRARMREIALVLGRRPNAVALKNAQTRPAKAKRQATRETKGLNSAAGTAAAVEAARKPEVVARRNATRRATGSFGPRRKFDPSREELDDLYQTHPMREIAKKYGVGETVVWKRIHEYGITFNDGINENRGKPRSMDHRASLSRAHKLSGRWLGENNPNYKGGPVTLVCQNPDCPLPDRKFTVVYARRETAKYCSARCRNKHLFQRETHPRWRDDYVREKVCPLCGRPFTQSANTSPTSFQEQKYCEDCAIVGSHLQRYHPDRAQKLERAEILFGDLDPAEIALAVK